MSRITTFKRFVQVKGCITFIDEIVLALKKAGTQKNIKIES